MTLQIADRVKETTTTTGTGALTLAGAMTSHRTFASVCAVSDTVYYALQAVDASGIPTGDWEVGLGTYSASNTLTRTTVLSSSNAGAAVNLAAGTKQVWLDWPAAALNSPLGSFRNKIIGGDFSTNPWQQGTNFVSPASATYTADRWFWFNTSTGAFTISQQSGSPPFSSAGRLITQSLWTTCTTADVSVDAGDLVMHQQVIEGYNFLSLAQRPTVLTFWHAHSKIGTYCIGIRNGGSDRSYVAEYQQASAGVWELATIRIPASPGAGTWNYTNGAGLQVAFVMMAGTNFQTAPNTWQTGSFLATGNQVNLADTVNNAFRIGLIQLESGSVATPFEDRSVGLELALCQRYCQLIKSMVIGYHVAGSSIGTNVIFPVIMRASPTLTPNSLGNSNAGTTTHANITASGYTFLGAITATGGAQVNSFTTASAEF